MNLTTLRNSRQNLTMIATIMKSSNENLKQLVSINSQLTKYIKNLVEGSLSTIFNYLQYFLFSFQIFVALLNLLTSSLVLVNKEEIRKVGKYIGHSSWCLSSLNIVILSLVVAFFFSIGVVLLNVKLILDETRKINFNFDDFNLQTFKDSSQTQFYTNCINPESDVSYLNQLFINYTETKDTLNSFYRKMIGLNYYDDIIDPFHSIRLLNDIKYFSDDLLDPMNVFLDDDVKKNPLYNMEYTLNRITDYKHSYPFMVMNNCPVYTAVEMFIRTRNCTYPINYNTNITMDDVLLGNICLDIIKMNESDLERIFKNHLKNCTKQFLEEGYDDLYEELLTGFKILKKFNEDFLKYTDYINSFLFK